MSTFLCYEKNPVNLFRILAFGIEGLNIFVRFWVASWADLRLNAGTRRSRRWRHFALRHKRRRRRWCGSPPSRRSHAQRRRFLAKHHTSHKRSVGLRIRSWGHRHKFLVERRTFSVGSRMRPRGSRSRAPTCAGPPSSSNPKPRGRHPFHLSASAPSGPARKSLPAPRSANPAQTSGGQSLALRPRSAELSGTPRRNPGSRTSFPERCCAGRNLAPEHQRQSYSEGQKTALPRTSIPSNPGFARAEPTSAQAPVAPSLSEPYSPPTRSARGILARSS